jgi:hypothetical protein
MGISDLAWGVFAVLCVAIGVSLLVDVVRQKVRERRACDQCPDTLRDGNYAAAQMARRCAYRLSCYCVCAPNCAMFTEAPDSPRSHHHTKRELQCITIS